MNMKKIHGRDVLKYGAILLLILLISILHYGTSVEHRYLHEIYQRIYYIPILLAAFWYGPVLGVLAATFTSLLYLYHIHRDWTHFPTYAFNQYAEIVLYHVLALVTGLLSLKERRHREKLEKATLELRGAYAKLQDTFERLRKADRLAALGQLSAGIAHEIRNPLGSIKGSVEILESEIPKESPKREFIGIIKEETTRLNSIVAEFLKFARPPKPSIEPASINALISSTLVLVQEKARESKVELLTQLEPLAAEVRLDPDQIRQVLLNILLNGIEAMPAGGTLTIRSENCKEGTCVAVEIGDTGSGVDGKTLEHIFDPFFTTKPQGNGLGLSISYQLVESHNGHLTARANPDRGMTFRIELPVIPAQASA